MNEARVYADGFERSFEMDEDWYLVGLPKTSLSGLTVRM